MKENKWKKTVHIVYLAMGVSKLIVDSTSLFDAIIVLDRINLRRLTANYT